ncbi:hypothetical protein ACFOY8_12120 [Thalassospira xianhensis]|uniref:Uncharacterized protein n=1 Tax=Thalassospira xianhensis MCCC 1A02616 TaxID=1177929 RepID=A0A367UDI8_9PROT|nr:hypothetical protein [Thalassospira xianhensis]RCK06386.1 hypothetical protein TH5_09345 [Thalassospira xianhensis MCCC 1A02616]
MNKAQKITDLLLSDQMDEQVVREQIMQMLKDKDITAMNEVVSVSEGACNESGKSVLDMIEGLSQRVELADGREALLFVLPVMLNLLEATDLPVPEVRDLIQRYASEDEQVYVANGWVHPKDVRNMDPITCSVLALSLAMSTTSGGENLTLPSETFPSFGQSLSEADDQLGVFLRPRDIGRNFTPVCFRHVMGLVVRSGGGAAQNHHLIANMSDTFVSDHMGSFCDDLRSVIKGSEAFYNPGNPWGCGIFVMQKLSSLELETRLQTVGETSGYQPVGHFSVDSEYRLQIVITAGINGVLDAVTLEAGEYDVDEVSRILRENCRAVCEHECPDTLPRHLATTMH